MTTPTHEASNPNAAERLGALLGVLLPVLDVVGEQVDRPEPPSWCLRRGWTDFLLGLRDGELQDAESRGLDSAVLGSAAAPSEFRELFSAVRRVTELPKLAVPPLPLPRGALRGVPERKREQLGVLLAVLDPFARRAARVVDVGAGSGHFARLSAELLGRETVAFDRDARRLERASTLREERSRQVGALDVQFVKTDLSRNELALRPTDLAVGLHACGELGDRLVRATAAARSELALVSCCLQKISEPTRVALSGAAGSFVLEKAALGLANLTFRSEGVEATLSENLRARETRLALRALLRQRGVDLRAGEEMRGVNRRRAHAGLAELCSHVLPRRGLRPASAAELKLHADAARRDHAAIRRLSLPRHLLSRLVELAIVFDRAASLEEATLRVEVVQLFESRVTPRNTLLLAKRH